jgi:hypothetical protein
VLVHDTAVMPVAVAQPQKFVGVGVAVIGDVLPELALVAEVTAFATLVAFQGNIVA